MKKNNKGFTLIELIVVVVVLGILAAIALPQYSQFMEKSRAAEAREGLGVIKKLAFVAYQEKNTVPGTEVINASGYPTACANTHFFSYSVGTAADTFNITANRCTSGGKSPQGSAGNLTLATDLNTTGSVTTDSWSGSPLYY